MFGEDAGKPVGDEDCLLLNVYVPVSDSTSPKAVMFWIHGGGFQMGAAQDYHPRSFLAEDVIVVAVNYRLGVFGFASFGNDLVSGNMGLRDQIEGLKWVQKHITHFGGDPSRVTIFGESAGGVSVSALHMSPLARGLFSGAIAQSGTMVMLREDAKVSKNWRTTQAIAYDFKCNTEYGEEMLKCLQAVPALEMLMGAQADIDPESKKFERSGSNPTSDYFSSDPVLPYDPLTALTLGEFNHIPLITGTVKNDGALLLGFAPLFGTVENYMKKAAGHLQIAGSTNKSEITASEELEADIMYQFYTGRSTNMSINQDGWSDMFTDVFFQNPDQKLAEMASKHVDVYNYVFTHKSENTFCQMFGLPDNSLAPIHGDDLLFQFPDLMETKYNEQDEGMARVMLKYWTQFAKHGAPSPPGQNLPTWNKFGTQKNYLDLSAEPEMKSNLNPSRHLFLQRIIHGPREAGIGEGSLAGSISDSIVDAINNIL